MRIRNTTGADIPITVSLPRAGYERSETISDQGYAVVFDPEEVRILSANSSIQVQVDIRSRPPGHKDESLWIHDGGGGDPDPAIVGTDGNGNGPNPIGRLKIRNLTGNAITFTVSGSIPAGDFLQEGVVNLELKRVGTDPLVLLIYSD